jgi:redox-sensitive bicupin YhaK (pirin superfamily)
MSSRRLQQIIPSVATSDGAGVSLRRSLGQSQTSRVDPFLMLDEFSSDDPDDYIAGFPSHPHRGFETVTYMLDGHMLHEDHLGNRGDLLPGGAQWMTAGRGIIHSEMPQQESGRMRGFQLWINLPAAEKMKPASYRDIRPEEIPTVALPGGGELRVIAGQHRRSTGPVRSPARCRAVDRPALHRRAPAGRRQLRQPVLPAGHSAFVYAYEGSLAIGPRPMRASSTSAGCRRAGLDRATGWKITAGGRTRPASCCWPRGRCGNPVVQYGPFVMNSREEIEQALADYRNNRLTLTHFFQTRPLEDIGLTWPYY